VTRVAWVFAGVLVVVFAGSTPTSAVQRCGDLDTAFHDCTTRVREQCADAACLYRRVCEQCYAHAMNPHATADEPSVIQGYARYCVTAGQAGRVEQLRAEIRACLADDETGEEWTGAPPREAAAVRCDALNQQFNADVRRYERLLAEARALRAEITVREESLKRQCP
jgi:hypothetical protein